jgi:hypothetical protein
VKRERPAGFTFWVFQRREPVGSDVERRSSSLDGSGNEETEPAALSEWLPSTL